MICGGLLNGTANGMDIGMKAYVITDSSLASLVARGSTGVVAIAVGLRYWSWLFSEFFGMQRGRV